jgi:hypothetical protein
LWYLEKNPSFVSDFLLIAFFLRNTNNFLSNSFSRRLRPSREDRSHCFMSVFITKLHLSRFLKRNKLRAQSGRSLLVAGFAITTGG